MMTLTSLPLLLCLLSQAQGTAATGTGDTTGKNNLGAAFNFNLLHHEPGGYAHNRFYVKRLLYDSIDWLDNNALDGSVATTLGALDDATSYKAGAISYLVTGFSR